MRWLRRRRRSKEDASVYGETTRKRLRGLAERGIDHEQDAAEVEARLRNLNYGTNRE